MKAVATRFVTCRNRLWFDAAHTLCNSRLASVSTRAPGRSQGSEHRGQTESDRTSEDGGEANQLALSRLSAVPSNEGLRLASD